ncbi:MAG: shikimate kinase, partial [Limosilactobacillus sp.]|nr:shikimate kinase [Limosilactobacillus sp.]
GGGTPMRNDNAQFLKQQQARVIVLTASPTVTWTRLHGDEQRPLAKQLNVNELGALQAQRAGRYLNCADFEIMTDDLTPGEVVDQIERFLATWTKGE